MPLNIDLLFTKRGEAGLVCDSPLPENLGVVHFDYEAGQLSLQFNDDTELPLNIPVDRVLSQFLVTRSDIHIGVI